MKPHFVYAVAGLLLMAGFYFNYEAEQFGKELRGNGFSLSDCQSEYLGSIFNVEQSKVSFNGGSSGAVKSNCASLESSENTSRTAGLVLFLGAVTAGGLGAYLTFSLRRKTNAVEQSPDETDR